MGDVTLDAYLFFSGDCRQAMEFYKVIFGGELSLQTYAEGPGTDDPTKKDLIIHANLSGGDIKLFASDTPEKDPASSSRVELCLGGSDEAKLTKLFETLSVGGTVRMPLEKQFWGDMFGTLTDKFGVKWMMNILAKKGTTN